MIEKTHHAQGAINLELLNLVERHNPCAYADLYRAFCADPSCPVATKRFNAKLSYLVYSEQLQCSGIGKKRSFWLGPLAGCRQPTAAAHPRKLALPEPALEHPRQVVPPRTIDINCPAYKPPHNPVLRPGALDYQRYASYGHGC